MSPRSRPQCTPRSGTGNANLPRRVATNDQCQSANIAFCRAAGSLDSVSGDRLLYKLLVTHNFLPNPEYVAIIELPGFVRLELQVTPYERTRIAHDQVGAATCSVEVSEIGSCLPRK